MFFFNFWHVQVGGKKSVDAIWKSVLKLLQLLSLKVICWKLTEIELLEVAKFFRRFVGMVTDVGGKGLGAQFSQIYLGSRKTYTKYVSLTALIFSNVTNLKALFPLWCRPIFPNWSVSKIEKTVFRQRTPRSTIWTPGTGYGRVDWNRSWYPSLLAGKRYSDTVFSIGSDLPVDQCDATTGILIHF